MTKQIAHQIITKWIKSCVTIEQVAIAHEAVCNLYDDVYHESGSKESEELHFLCFQQKEAIETIPGKLIKDEIDPYNLNVAGKD